MMKNRLVYLILLIFALWLLALSFLQPKQQTPKITYTQNKIIGFTTDITKIADKLSENVAILEGKNGFTSAFLYSQVNAKSYFLTSCEALNEEETIILHLANTYQITAKVVAEDKAIGVSVLEAELPYKVNDVVVGDSEQVKAGELLICLGSINEKINSVGPNLEMVAKPFNNIKQQFLYKHKYVNYYKRLGLLSRPLNRSYLGGPLFNMAGQLVGLSIFGDEKENINYYVPSNYLQALITKVLNGEEVNGLSFGFSAINVLKMPSYLRSIMGIKLDINEGFYIQEVLPESLAASAGLRKGDILLAINGVGCRSEKDLAYLHYNISQQYEFKIVRQQEEKILKTEVIIND